MKTNPTRRASLAADERGMVLLSTLLILSAVSLIAVSMSGDTSTALQIAGYRRQVQQDFQLADGGVDVGVHVLLDYLYPDAVDPDTDYPAYDDTITLVPGRLSMTHFYRDVNLLADIKGYPGNDNEDDPDFENPALHPPDISFELVPGSGLPLSESAVFLDVDRLKVKYMVGSSIEFASGYEGIGKGAGAGSVAVYYGVRSRGATAVSVGDPRSRIRAEVGTVYRKVSQIVGGGE